MTSRAVLSAGSNIGDSRAHLQRVVSALGSELRAASSVYLTPPWGGVEQDDFANITIIAEGERTPREWLEFCWEMEREAQRVRDVRWGPRTLDVDVVTVEVDGATVISDDPELTLPHPRAAQRAFVLVPWLEIDPDARLVTPDGELAVTTLIEALDPDEVAGVRRAGAAG
ncbi:2-amino-4-hydroxy-6-hydroxymethyldihydropteridine diphosphokinase [Gordonia neofelifaecis]|uniref:2-amino-4-hydroxy-6-hydroxymethyldihydropteridine diphosphokinase n=1 Tax=Gordonia neofelifaecis NRRL B-59395 TaxID=644548 RepID=F1YLP0_9ACTN|nr:2-amino-4-hydroxy-6-hydroxymethyldihydropteridine diphosphokinase [Gordonia neofelifaecis]EGD54434.1 2-amino-4-hydroxy-6-hydroxymethyldihydropteridin epyrophosphokinase [Gordonia neofelifaecis NRRL B-59395]